MLETGKLNLTFQIVREHSWHTVLPVKWRLRIEQRNSILIRVQIWEVPLTGWKFATTNHLGLWHVISIELLHSFLGYHFAGKPVFGKMLALFSGLISFLLRVFYFNVLMRFSSISFWSRVGKIIGVNFFAFVNSLSRC